MPDTYYESELTGAQIENALKAIHGVVSPSNNGKVLAIENGSIVPKSASEWTDTAVLEPLNVSANGDYTPPTGTDGFNSVHVAVPSATLATKNITSNGTYNASQDDADGYSSVIVAVPGGATIEPLTVTENGTYNPPSGVNGYAPVTVNVSGGEGDPTLPAEYQEVEYIQCYDYQHILLGQGVLWKIVSIDVSQDAISSSESGFAGYDGGGRPEFYFKNGNVYWYSSAPSIDSAIISGVTSGERVNVTVTFLTSSSNFRIGCYRLDNYPFQGKIYRAEIKQQNNGVRTLFKPCYRKADDVIGFYDLIGGTFFTNQGAGSFGKGPDVN